MENHAHPHLEGIWHIEEVAETVNANYVLRISILVLYSFPDSDYHLPKKSI